MLGVRDEPSGLPIDTPPVICWLGAAPPPDLSAVLGSTIAVQRGFRHGARLVALWSDADPSILDALPPSGADRPPVLVACQDAPPDHLRRLWEGAGADQVVALSALPGTLVEWLQGARRGEGTADPPTFEPRSLAGLADELEPSLAIVSGPVRVDPADPFPPLRLPGMPAQGSAEIERYVTALQRYLERRDEVVRLLGEDGLTRFLELAHLREQVPASLGGRQRLDPYGRGRGTELPDWKVAVRRMKTRTREIEVSEGRLAAIGTDGVVLVTLFAAAPRQRLLVDLPVDADHNVQLMFEARWQRRVGAKRWHVGALLVEMRWRPLDGSA